jgi:uridine kinase
VSQIDDIVQRIANLSRPQSTVLVAIDSCGAAGKTVLATRLSSALAATGRRTDVVHFDDFYLPAALRPTAEAREKLIGPNFDWRRLRDQVLLPLRSERDAVFARYDWPTDRLAELHTVAPPSTVIVEGVTCCRNELAHLYDLRIWVECPRDVRLRRGIERDGEKSRQLWQRDWMPSEDRYVEQHRPHERADVIVSGTAS